MGILLVGAVAALFFRNEPLPRSSVPELRNGRELDRAIASRQLSPYTSEVPERRRVRKAGPANTEAQPASDIKSNRQVDRWNGSPARGNEGDHRPSDDRQLSGQGRTTDDRSPRDDSPRELRARGDSREPRSTDELWVEPGTAGSSRGSRSDEVPRDLSGATPRPATRAIGSRERDVRESGGRSNDQTDLAAESAPGSKRNGDGADLTAGSPRSSRATTPLAEHLVEQGETLSAIARRYYGRESRWTDILRANPDLLADPHSLRPGMRLQIPRLINGDEAAGSPAPGRSSSGGDRDSEQPGEQPADRRKPRSAPPVSSGFVPVPADQVDRPLGQQPTRSDGTSLPPPRRRFVPPKSPSGEGFDDQQVEAPPRRLGQAPPETITR